MESPNVATAIFSAALFLLPSLFGTLTTIQFDSLTPSGAHEATRGDLPSLRPVLTEVYYDTLVADEYVAIANQGENDVELSGWRLTDLEGILGFPQLAVIRAKGRIVVSQNSTLYMRDTLQVPDFSIDGALSPAMTRIGGSFQLKNDGDEVILKDSSGEVVDAFAFGLSTYNGGGWSGPSAPVVRKGHVALRESLGGVYLDTNSSTDWDGLRVPVIGQSSDSPPDFEFDGVAQVIVSPAGALEELSGIIDSARDLLFLNLYEFTSDSLAARVLAASERGVDVRLLMEGAPVGGIREIELSILQSLEAANADVHLMLDNSSNGVRARYRFDHAKYLVSDNKTVVVGSENWGETAFPSDGSSGNRGWSLRLDNPALATYLAGVFLEDWNPARTDILELGDAAIVAVAGEDGDAVGSPATFTQEPLAGHFNVTLLMGPDNSLDDDTIIGMMRSAERNLHIEQFYISPDWGGISNIYLEEALNAARRGVMVRILLDASWYNIDQNDTMDNDDVVRALQETAKAEGIPLMAKLANADSHGLTKFHNKGVVVDGRKVLISSLNWNLNSVTENRELGLIVDSPEIAGFLDGVFEHDWKDDVTPPIADAGSDLEVYAGDEVILASTGSRDDVGIVSYSWDVGGDGSIDLNGSIATCRFMETGAFEVVLHVEDAWGNAANDSILVDVVSRPPPVAGGSGTPTWIAALAAIVAVAVIALFVKSRRK